MEKIIASKKVRVIAQAAFAMLVILSMFFCFSYYTWSSDAYKTAGFEFLGIFLKDYGFFEICLLISLILSVLIIIVNILVLCKNSLREQNWLSFLVAGAAVIVIFCGIILFIGSNGYIVITTIEACETSEIFRGAGSYMHLIFSTFVFTASVIEIYCLKKSGRRSRSESV